MHPLLSKKKTVSIMVPTEIWEATREVTKHASRSMSGYVSEALLEKLGREPVGLTMATIQPTTTEVIIPNPQVNDGTEQGASVSV